MVMSKESELSGGITRRDAYRQLLDENSPQAE